MLILFFQREKWYIYLYVNTYRGNYIYAGQTWWLVSGPKIRRPLTWSERILRMPIGDWSISGGFNMTTPSWSKAQISGSLRGYLLSGSMAFLIKLLQLWTTGRKQARGPWASMGNDATFLRENPCGSWFVEVASSPDSESTEAFTFSPMPVTVTVKTDLNNPHLTRLGQTIITFFHLIQYFHHYDS